MTWEGTSTSYAFRDPYLLAFEPSFIEVRNVETGLLEQIIEGQNYAVYISIIENANIFDFR
ncbi:72_t:CDS:2 [Ambispora leptoticha]|uniref:72_t:CDS:1 n=1 Tax=Ambispora leptoticha TaxID=144679 RepID=A0A9N9A6V2_9GLOM|nr:72_t:CDS:2 [Ambispora leptoticha]